MIYQLRLPAASGLPGLAAEIIKSMERELGTSLAPQAQDRVNDALLAHLQGFDTCGASSLCDECTFPAKWNLAHDPLLLSSNPQDSDKVVRYHLLVPNDSLPGVAAALLQAAGLPSDEARRDAALGAVAGVLAPHLFYGELCRKIDHCENREPLALTLQAD